MLQHERKDSGLLGLAFDRFQNVLLVGEVKRTMHGYKQGPDVLVILKLFQECLASRLTCHQRFLPTTI